MHRFAHDYLDCFRVAREALVLGHALVGHWPRGNACLGDQLRRALLGCYLQLSEAAARAGADRTQRFRVARAEANEAAAAVEAAVILGLSSAAQGEQLLSLLARVVAMLTRLGGFGRSQRT